MIPVCHIHKSILARFQGGDITDPAAVIVETSESISVTGLVGSMPANFSQSSGYRSTRTFYVGSNPGLLIKDVPTRLLHLDSSFQLLIPIIGSANLNASSHSGVSAFWKTSYIGRGVEGLDTESG